MKANEIFSDFFEFCWIILNFMTLEFKALSMSDWMSQSESKDLCIILHFFRFVQIFPEVFRYIQIYSDIFGYFAIFPHILRFIEILLDLSWYIYLCWHKTRAKGKFVQWFTLEFFSLWTSQTLCNMTINALWQSPCTGKGTTSRKLCVRVCEFTAFLDWQSCYNGMFVPVIFDCLWMSVRSLLSDSSPFVPFCIPPAAEIHSK